jgi:CDP-6-deoxy-D-xylo-4-hexulose-3-dehydrase
MADAPASFGIKQLEKLDDMTKIRIDNAKYLCKELSKFDSQIALLQNNSKEFLNSYYSFPIIIVDTDEINRKDFTRYLESNSIETRAIMCGTLPDQPSLVNIGHEYGGLEGSRYIMNNSFFVGCHPCLEKDELDHIIHTITNYLTK